MTTKNTEHPKVVSREEWLRARKELLLKEKKLTRERDNLSAERRNLTWVKVEKEYIFDSTNEKVTLAELFGDKPNISIF